MNIVSEVRIATLDIPSIGMCTLLPCNYVHMPDEMRTYEKIEKLASAISLTALPELSHAQTQQIFGALSFFFSEEEVAARIGLGVVLSGIHFSFVSIDTSSESLCMEQCVTLLDFSTWNKKGKKLTNRPFANYFEMDRDEIPVNEHFSVTNRNIVYCLFLGTYENDSEE